MRNNLIKIVSLVSLAIVLTACGSKKNVDPLPTFKPTLSVNPLWETSVGSGAAKQYLKLQPLVQNNLIYVTSRDGRVTAVDNQGRHIWQTNLRSKLSSGATVANGLVFVGGEGNVIALNQNNGALRWKTAINTDVLARPTTAGNLVVVNALGSKLFALNQQSGKVVWNYSQPNPPLTLRGSSAPQISGNTVVAGFPDGELVAFNLHNGNVLWRTQAAFPQGMNDMQRLVDIDADPQIRNGSVYAVSYQGQLSAISLTTGQILWNHNISAYSGLAINNGNLFVTASDGTIWALSRSSGKVLWQQSGLQGRNLTAPVLQNNLIVVADDQGYVHWLSQRDGYFVARIRTGKQGVLARPAVNGNQTYIYNVAGRLFAYSVH